MAWKIGKAIVLEHYACIYIEPNRLVKAIKFLHTQQCLHTHQEISLKVEKKKGRKARREGRIIG